MQKMCIRPSLQVLGQPDEAGAEHGVGSGQEIEFQGFDRGAGVDDVFGELFGDLSVLGGLAQVC